MSVSTVRIAGKNIVTDAAVPAGRVTGYVADYLDHNSTFNIKDYGAIGDGSSHPLSERYATLAAAQEVYSFATALTNEIDWCADQLAANLAAAHGAGTQGQPLTYVVSRVHRPRGHYRWHAPVVYPTCIGLVVTAEGAPAGQAMTTTQWSGTDQPGSYMVDARSVLGFVFRDQTFIGQSDLSNDASPCCGSGIWTRRYASGNFNSFNDWRNITCYRFPVEGIRIGDYVGWNGSSYPADYGQTDNSIFTNITCEDCRVGIVLNTPNFLSCLWLRPFVYNYGGNPVGVDGVTPKEDASACPIKFRTKNAVQILYGQFHAVSANLYASYADADAWSQYAIYCQDGSFVLHGGYTEVRYFAYVGAGANGTGSSTWNNHNAIRDVNILPGEAGGPVTAGKHQIYYAQPALMLHISGLGWTDISEAASSAGVFVEGQDRIVFLTAGTYAIKVTEHGTTFMGDATAGVVYPLLPGPASTVIGQKYTCVNLVGANNVVISPQGTDTIDGAASVSIAAGHARTVMYKGGGKWISIGGY